MAHHYKINFTKTYATEANAEKAVNKLLTQLGDDSNELMYTIIPISEMSEFGIAHIRYGVLFVGYSAIRAGVHFHFNVVAND